MTLEPYYVLRDHGRNVQAMPHDGQAAPRRGDRGHVRIRVVRQAGNQSNYSERMLVSLCTHNDRACRVSLEAAALR